MDNNIQIIEQDEEQISLAEKRKRRENCRDNLVAFFMVSVAITVIFIVVGIINHQTTIEERLAEIGAMEVSGIDMLGKVLSATIISLGDVIWVMLGLICLFVECEMFYDLYYFLANPDGIKVIGTLFNVGCLIMLFLAIVNAFHEFELEIAKVYFCIWGGARFVGAIVWIVKAVMKKRKRRLARQAEESETEVAVG